jgi:ubiquinone/menaquinone biosynthesis C-methylase UbiE
VDWGTGHYETTAAQLLPAAHTVVQRAALKPGERVLDLGCGTGNAALLAAEQAASVTGVDPAERLLEVARSRAVAEHKELSFVHGEAAALPIGDASVDVALSVFAVIFAGDPAAAAAEVSRVLAPQGRFLLSAWIPTGAFVEMNTLAADTVRKALGAPPPPPPFAWHDADALSKLLAPHGFHVDVEHHALTITAPSARQYLETELRNHPLAVTATGLLEQLGQADALRTRILDILEAANETPEGFQVTARYVVAIARR